MAVSFSSPIWDFIFALDAFTPPDSPLFFDRNVMTMYCMQKEPWYMRPYDTWNQKAWIEGVPF